MPTSLQLPAVIWLWWVFFILLGACVGSFLNVVIYRLPEGLSILRPASRCPKCGTPLAWHDNVPVLGWLWLRGRCRYCREPISIQYPLIEALTAALFGVLFWANYISSHHPQFHHNGLAMTWPMMAVQLALLAAMLAATVIDARLYIIPLPIPWTVTLLALVALPVAAVWWPGPMEAVAPLAGPRGAAAAIGGVAGLLLAHGLLWLRWIPYSFSEESYEAPAHESANAPSSNTNQPNPAPATVDSPEHWLAHPHPRREVLKECMFVAWPLLGMSFGWMHLAAPLQPWFGYGGPVWLRVLAGVALGYLVGGGMIWLTRIGGTLAFRKEAMGLGDVHLLAAIGAVLGWQRTVVVFFLAPFLGLIAVLLMVLLIPLLRAPRRVVPYGPYLALAAVAAMAAPDSVLRWLLEIFGIL